MKEPLPPGLYEKLLTERLRRYLAEKRHESLVEFLETVDPAEAPRILAQHFVGLLEPFLASFTTEDALGHQVQVVNHLVEALASSRRESPVGLDDRSLEPPRLLKALLRTTELGLAEATEPTRPSIPLSVTHLLVNGPRDRSMVGEIQREILSSDRVDLLVSFLKWSGWRLIRDPVRRFLENRHRAFRVLTTTYLGATDPRVVDELVDLGAQVKISYDIRRTRLHAKAWLFHRESGYGTALVGSSNLSAAAMTEGLEWNVRLSQVETPGVLDQFRTTFEQYWNEGEFEEYDRVRDAERLRRALAAARGHTDTGPSRLKFRIHIRPFPFQQEILDELAAERRKGHTRNLVVAATGTGKTVIAALDFKRLLAQEGNLSLLFVAHRKEILEQSLETFRLVLRDDGFGEYLLAGRRPERGSHVFASIQSLGEERLEALDPEHYDMVIVDEFHHAAAPTYDRLLHHVKPKYLLGLTATPERTDGQTILGHFEHRIASELRLWHALDQQLLCPFHYFAVGDDTDFSTIGWQGGRYVTSDLENVVTGDHVRAERILRALEDVVKDVDSIRALGFCVSVRHAEFMAEQFVKHGVRAEAVTGQTSREMREGALRRLKAGETQVVFTVDLFNEGVDVPEIDTVLFLRPTESATLFLQQLGRGLRLVEGKECLTALDFVGHMHKKFRFDRRFAALLGGTRKQLFREAREGFPRLPPGCAIHLDERSQEEIVDNIRESLGLGRKAMAEDLQALGQGTTIGSFLEATGLELGDLYSGGDKGWTELRRRAGHLLVEESATERSFRRALGRLLHVNDDLRWDAWRGLLETGEIPESLSLDRAEHRLLLMLSGSLDSEARPIEEHPALLREFLAHPHLVEELLQLLDLLEDRARIVGFPHELHLPHPLPLRIHGEYQLVEIMAAFGALSGKNALLKPQAGVLWRKESRSDLFFVTLEKSEKDYSPTTMYRDYPISPTLFHWQSQSTTRRDSVTGLRYREHVSRGTHVLFFVRRRKKDERGHTMPYLFLGPASFVHSEGERPMSITWSLHHPMPGLLFEETKVAAG